MDYNRIAQTVLTLLKKHGRDVVLRKVVGGAFDPIAQKKQPGAVEDEPRKAVTTDQPGTRIGPQYGTNLQPGTLIRKDEKWIYMDGVGAKPMPGDKVLINNEMFNVVDSQVTAPAGIALFYLVVLRK
jgi:hypothetical protein